jgi:hypothetical protein
LAKHSIPVVPHPPYSPKLPPPCDFFPFPRLKSTPKEKRFQDVAKIQLNTTRQMQAIPNKPTTHALKSGKTAGIAAYYLKIVLSRR